MANYVFNSSSSGEKYNAKCLNVSDDSEWTPSVAEYPQDGTIDLSGGTSGRYLDTQWIAPQDEEWTMSGIYNVVMGVSYDMYSIHYKGNQTCDIYLGSDTEDLTLSESDKDYTPPTGTWIIEEEPPDIIIPPVSSYTVYVNFDDTNTPITSPITNTITEHDLSDAPADFLDTTGATTGMTVTTVVTTNYTSCGNGTTGQGVCFDDNLNYVLRHLRSTNGLASFNLTLPAGTFTILSMSSVNASGVTFTTLSVDGVEQTVDPSTNTTTGICAEWTGVSGGRDVLISIAQNGASPSVLSSLKITRTS